MSIPQMVVRSRIVRSVTIRRKTAGGAIYHQNSTNLIDNCIFENNASGSGSRGGAIFNTDSPGEISNSVFEGNISLRTGGAIHYEATERNGPVLNNCSFVDNRADSPTDNRGWGGAITAYNAGLGVTANNCSFEDNYSFRSGGAFSVGFGAVINLVNCDIKDNESQDSGGGAFLQNDRSEFNLTNCLIENNTAADAGGGISGSGSQSMNIENTSFLFNICNNGSGGAITLVEDTLDVSVFTATNTIFVGNSCTVQGGALNFSDVDAMLVNCEIGLNFSGDDPGRAGAIQNNGSEPTGSNLSIMNSTIASNFGLEGSGIVQWAADIGVANLILQNVILHNPDGNSYEVETGSLGPTNVMSNGGNLCSDATLNAILTNTNDITELDPQFENYGAQDYHLTVNSPSVDMGVATGAPANDLDGNPRQGDMDQGAYELVVVGTEIVSPNTLGVSVTPNVTNDFVRLNIDEQVGGNMTMNIYDNKGQLIRSQIIDGRFSGSTELNLNDLTSGKYFLYFQIEDKIAVESVIKM